MKTVFCSKMVSLHHEVYGESKFLSLLSRKFNFDLTLAYGVGFPTISLSGF